MYSRLEVQGRQGLVQVPVGDGVGGSNIKFDLNIIIVNVGVVGGTKTEVATKTDPGPAKSQYGSCPIN